MLLGSLIWIENGTFRKRSSNQEELIWKRVPRVFVCPEFPWNATRAMETSGTLKRKELKSSPGNSWSASTLGQVHIQVQREELTAENPRTSRTFELPNTQETLDELNIIPRRLGTLIPTHRNLRDIQTGLLKICMNMEHRNTCKPTSLIEGIYDKSALGSQMAKWPHFVKCRLQTRGKMQTEGKIKY